MGKIILTVEGTSVGTVAAGRGVVLEKTVSEADSARLVAAWASMFDVPFQGPSDIAPVIQRWFDWAVETSAARALELERARAAVSVPPIVVS